MHIKDKISVIFDVGCRSESEYIDFDGEVHYFDPIAKFVEALKSKTNKNKTSYFNHFGLGDENNLFYYYPRYQSFYDRKNSCIISDEPNKILLHTRKGYDYVLEKDLKSIDFLKIDTEGYEFKVLQGFGDFIEKINIIQFEYGGTFLDNNVKLIDVINYLKGKGFCKFSYLTNSGPVIIKNFDDHYQYCNIVCINERSLSSPF